MTVPAARPANADPEGKTQRGLVNGVFQGFTSFEAWNLGSRDVDRVTSLRVATSTGSALFNSKSTEAYQHNGVAGLQSASYGFNHCIQRTASNSFWDISRCGDGINQFRLVHS
jgi:predicted small integral membrane protein